MANVFISYSSSDRPFALQLANDLQQAGHSVWIDQWRITGRTEYWDEIQAGIEFSTHFVFVISPESIDRASGARRELYHAANLKPIPVIVPIMVRETLLKQLPMLISPGMYQIHNFVHKPYQAALSDVKGALLQGASVSPAPTPTLTLNYPVAAAAKPKRAKTTPLLRTCAVLMGLFAILGVVGLIGGVALILSNSALTPTPTITQITQIALQPTSLPLFPASPASAALPNADPATITPIVLVPTRFVTKVPLFVPSFTPTNAPVRVYDPTPWFDPTPTTFLLPPPVITATPPPPPSNNSQACPGSTFPFQFKRGDLAVSLIDLRVYSDVTTDEKVFVGIIPQKSTFVINDGPQCYKDLTMWNVTYKDKDMFSGWTYESEIGKGYFMEPYR